MHNLKNRTGQNWTELDKAVSICSRIVKFWVFQALLIIVAVVIAISGSGSGSGGILLIIPMIIICFIINVCLSLSLLLNGGEDYFVRRQRSILLAVWAIEFFLGITLIIPLIAKYFFYKGYKELSEAVETRNHEILQNNGRKSKGGGLIMAIILIILAFLFFIILLAGAGMAGYYLR